MPDKLKTKKEESNKKRIKTGFIILFFLAAIVLLGNALKTREKTEPPSQEDQESKRVEIESFEDRLPDNFPEDFPVLENMEIVSASASDTSVSVVWNTKDTIENVKDYYKVELDTRDWTYDISDSDNVFIYKLKKNEKEGFMAIAETNGITTITIAIGLQ